MPLILTFTPLSCVGRGTNGALCAAPARPEPNIARIIPGAYTCLNEAAFVAPVTMTGRSDYGQAHGCPLPRRMSRRRRRGAEIDKLPDVSCAACTVSGRRPRFPRNLPALPNPA